MVAPSTLRADDDGVLTSIRQVRRLSLDEARKRHPVRIEGVVTHRRLDGSHCFIQNGEGGICCSGEGRLKFALNPGRRVRIEGTTMTGGYAQAIAVDRISDLGPAPLPEPAVVSLAQIVSGRWDGQYVEVRGVVRAASLHPAGQWTVDIASERHRVTVTVEHGLQTDPADWVDGVVRVRGVAGVNANRLGQLVSVALRVQQREDVVLEEPPHKEPFSKEAQPIQSIMKFSPEPIEGRRVKVAGTVLHQQPDGTLYLQDQSGGVMVGCRPPASLNAGDRVEVLGFPVWGDYSPQLEDACFRHLGSGQPPVPAEVAVERLIEGRLNAQLVQLDARLVAQTRSPDEHLLMLKSGNVLLPARLASSSGALPALRPGSLLRLTGICRAQLRDRQFRTGQPPAPVFDLVLRSPRDIAVLQAAPWWNLQRALWLAAGVSALLLGAMGWVFLLRRRVSQQTALIADKLQAQATAEERMRVARELHDTVEQDLTAVALHLSVIQNHGSPLTPVAQENLADALRQGRRSQEDAHCAVWDLRSATLRQRGLPAAIKEVLTLAVSGRSVASKCEVQGLRQRLSNVVEHHLLRIAQEAITNAVRHAEPKEILVTLAYDPASVAMRVKDDGCGFEAAVQPLLAQRFGLLGMHERAARIGAALSIHSASGQGAVVEVTLPAS